MILKGTSSTGGVQLMEVPIGVCHFILNSLGQKEGNEKSPRWSIAVIPGWKVKQINAIVGTGIPLWVSETWSG